MNAGTPTSIPPQRTTIWWALLLLSLAVGFYGLALLLAAACVYLSLLYLHLATRDHPWISPVPVASMVLVVFVIFMTAKMLWSVRPCRYKFSSRRLPLERFSHPRLFKELESIAGELNEPMPEEVFLSGDVNAWVANRGGVMGLGSRRIMGIGLPLLSILTVSQFRAVLAHEFGHYYRGDTRLGPLVYRTRRAMERTMETLKAAPSREQEVRLGLAEPLIAKLLRVLILAAMGSYQDLFLRMTSRISLRQEYRADELACHVAGSLALVESLRRIRVASEVFTSYWEKEVVPILNAGYRPPIADGFARFSEAPNVSKAGVHILEREMGSARTASKVPSITTLALLYNSHPPLPARIMAARILPERKEVQNTDCATTLLGDIQALEVQFLEEFGSQPIKPSLLKPLNWSEVATLVTVPRWKRLVQQYAHLLSGITAEDLSDAVSRLREIGAKMRDPKGMLLSPAQRTTRAGELLGMALGLALLDNGWQVHQDPGQFFLRRSNESLNPMDLVTDIISGKLTREVWTAHCRVLGIAGKRLGDIVTARPI